MNLKHIKVVPLILSGGVLAMVCFFQSLRWWTPWTNTFERLEWQTYDWRAQYVQKLNPPVATNFGLVAISDSTIEIVREGNSIGLPEMGLYWPRVIHGRLVRELKRQGARAIAFDVMFGEQRIDHNRVPFYAAAVEPGQELPSDFFFAEQIKRAGNVVLATTGGVIPDDLFRLNARALGNITAEKDSDGVLRRAKPYHTYRLWELNIIQQLRNGGRFQLETAVVGRDAIRFRNAKGEVYSLPLNEQGEFNLLTMTDERLGRDYLDAEGRRQLLASLGGRPWVKPFEEIQVWHMGIVVAAMELGLDLSRARVDEAARQLILPGTNQVNRTIPLDHRGYFYIDWSVPVGDPRLRADGLEYTVMNDTDRERGEAVPAEAERFKDRLVFIGSTATGNELTDVGQTPLGKDTFLVSKHWNVANSVIMNRFITRVPLAREVAIILVLGLFAGVVTGLFRPPVSTLIILLVAGAYVWWGVEVYVASRTWYPFVLPVGGALIFNHVSLVGYQVVFENRERQRVKGMFAKLVSPNVVNELLKEKEVHLGGQRRRLTVFFSDVRGFTTMTDEMQAYADGYVKEHGLEGAAAEAFYDRVAADTLETVNLYLATIADQIKKHDGTLDKYIGDCVMAFWGAPTPNEQHAVACVRATIDAQLAMNELNIRRAAENEAITAGNVERAARGEPPVPLKRLLVMGSGVNTGTAIVGLMGSEKHIFNFTVFGRDVNVASRLEGVSGRGRIIIGEATHRDLLRFAPELAAICTEEDPVKVKGIAEPVRIFEVPWRQFLPPDQVDMHPLAPKASSPEGAPEGKLQPAPGPAAVRSPALAAKADHD